MLVQWRTRNAISCSMLCSSWVDLLPLSPLFRNIYYGYTWLRRGCRWRRVCSLPGASVGIVNVFLGNFVRCRELSAEGQGVRTGSVQQSSALQENVPACIRPGHRRGQLGDALFSFHLVCRSFVCSGVAHPGRTQPVLIFFFAWHSWCLACAHAKPVFVGPVTCSSQSPVPIQSACSLVGRCACVFTCNISFITPPFPSYYTCNRTVLMYLHIVLVSVRMLLHILCLYDIEGLVVWDWRCVEKISVKPPVFNDQSTENKLDFDLFWWC